MGGAAEVIVIGNFGRYFDEFVSDIVLSALWGEGARVHA